MIQLSPAEQYVLLDPRKAEAREAVKVTLLSLVAQGALKIDTISQKAVFGTKKRRYPS